MFKCSQETQLLGKFSNSQPSFGVTFTPQATSQFEAKKTPRALHYGHFFGGGGETLCQERFQGWDI